MPSYRVSVDVVGVRAGVRPEEVLPAAERILAKTHQVEDRSIEVAHAQSARPQPQLHLRFLVPTTEREADDAAAAAVVRLLVDELDDSVATCGRWELRRGPGRRWRLMASGGPVSAR